MKSWRRYPASCRRLPPGTPMQELMIHHPLDCRWSGGGQTHLSRAEINTKRSHQGPSLKRYIQASPVNHRAISPNNNCIFRVRQRVYTSTVLFCTSNCNMLSLKLLSWIWYWYESDKRLILLPVEHLENHPITKSWSSRQNSGSPNHGH